MTRTEFRAEYDAMRTFVDAELEKLPRGDGRSERIAEAMRYSLLAGGKRIRPILVLCAAQMAGGETEEALPAALAIECIHTYSLIHDDLPCMDDDALRRGRPTSHVVYGEAMALLTGDALLNYAFELLCTSPTRHPERRLAAAEELATGAGLTGMIGGQVRDVGGEADTEEKLRDMCSRKTGALIRAAVRSGCRSAGASEELLCALTEYADCVGLAFQMVDDALDVVGDAAALGKNTGSDAKDGKTTFATLLGVEECLRRAEDLTRRAKEAIRPFAQSGFLCELADVLLERKN